MRFIFRGAKSLINRNVLKPLVVGIVLTLPLSAAADKPETPDMQLIEFLGSLETRGDSGKEILTAIDTGLLPDLPEEPPNEEVDK